MDEYAICPVCRRGFWRNEPWKALWVGCWRQRKQRETADARQSIAVPDRQSDLVPDDEMLRRLLQLCHPDRHDGNEAATIATRWLLSLRERLRA